jgi:hypothetical protein
MYKVITGRLLEAQGYYSEVKRKSEKILEQKERALLGASEKVKGY